MKRIMWFVAVLMIAETLTAQIFSHVELHHLVTMRTGEARVAGISPDGGYALVTSLSNKGLMRLDLSNGKSQQLCQDEGAGIQPEFSSDGENIVAQSITYDKQHLRRTSLRLLSVNGAEPVELTAPSREMPISASRALKASASNRKPLISDNIRVFSDDCKLMVEENGQTRQLTPNGDGEDVRYIWPSLSPDGKRILYYVSDEGAYVCDLDGQNVQYISLRCQAPQWYDDQTIIGMDERDDSEFILSSCIVAYGLDGSRQQLTEPSELLMYPFCSERTGRIVCANLKGEVYTINVSK